MSDRPANSRTILFTGFEPSGDAHAAPVIKALLERDPTLMIHAWGGDQMKAAGANIIEHTCSEAAMAASAVLSPKVIYNAWRQIQRIERWAAENHPPLHVPVDAPAANFPVCKRLRKFGTKTVHFVAPQIWAWGGWRINKLRRLTDHVICLLPFEEQWFQDRNVPATFVGHPVINRDATVGDDELRKQEFPTSSPRIGLFPGSRGHEAELNLPILLDVFKGIREQYPNAVGLLVVGNNRAADVVNGFTGNLPDGLGRVTKALDAAIQWCDLAVAVSGTISLDLARHCKPMVAVYRASWTTIAGSKVLLKTPDLLLPNIIAGRRIVPEFIPQIGSPQPVIDTACKLLKDEQTAQKQRDELKDICDLFAGHDPDNEAAEIILRVLDSTA